jgi:glycosyltransferase involved in cell wall biosynthesis
MSERARVLMVAYHYPPFFGSSGVHRTLKFSRYLPSMGWQPIVLTAHQRAYAATRVEQVKEIPDSVVVHRAFAMDAKRHLAIRGRSLRLFSIPDAWASWWFSAVPQGLRLVTRYRPQVLWSTFPIATAQLIALTLHRATGLPWVLDLRDPMIEGDYPADPSIHRAYRWIERHCVERASRLVFTTDSTREMYLGRYPGVSPQRCLVITNGYDEADFDRIGAIDGRAGEARVRMVHSGLIYPEERDPRPLFRAIAMLKESGRVSSETFVLDLRAPGSDDCCRRWIDEMRIGDIVRILPSLPYREALADCATASALLLLQDELCDRQIPAKAYEYLRLGLPILALTTAQGDTASLLRRTGGGTVLGLRDADAIADGLPRFLDAVRLGHHPIASVATVRQFSREAQTRALARILSETARDPSRSAR